ncbi:hypothetical protein [Sphingomonas sp. Sph1(2015)]|uniref:hypothetical protein n=1 Tax=Sphingomonas sp. Sph1(2015) TaxID=1628084 RepID=UPI0013016CD3|nr:hypothetical protein [Sphingomonas sp. Sph1(2015)]
MTIAQDAEELATGASVSKAAMTRLLFLISASLTQRRSIHQAISDGRGGQP